MSITVGELRYSSAGNVFRLERIDGLWRYVRHLSDGDGNPAPFGDRLERRHASGWEEALPLVGGDTSEYPHFGLFIP